MLLKQLFVTFIFLSFWQSLSVAGKDNTSRYIFFDVNPGEGFNLRRDVFVRIAVFVKRLNMEKKGNFVLVLPPWGRLYHWQSPELGYQVKIPWKSFFDLSSINRYVPVIDLEDYLAHNNPTVDSILYLQNYKEGWTNGEFVEKFDFRDCIEPPRYHKEESTGLYRGWFWEYDEMRAREFKCLSVQGRTKVIEDLVVGMNKKSIFLERSEQLLHDWFGDEEYWSVRRSMRFSRTLVDLADVFRREVLGSDDVTDKTVVAERWEDQKPIRGSASGGQYLCVHMRRKDYAISRSQQIPSVKGAAEQVEAKLKKLDLKSVFVATDAPREEFEEFRSLLKDYKVVKFNPEAETLQRHRDGGVAIVDQIICSHAKYFLGSPESTFTFRIQEEREIMGFHVDQTFGMLCPEGKFDCEKGSIWEIKYPQNDNKHNEL